VVQGAEFSQGLPLLGRANTQLLHLLAHISGRLFRLIICESHTWDLFPGAGIPHSLSLLLHPQLQLDQYQPTRQAEEHEQDRHLQLGLQMHNK